MEKLYLANSVVLKPGRVYQEERLSERGLYKTENGDTGWLRKHIWSDFVLKRRETNIDDGDTEYSKDKEMKCLQKDKQQEGEHDNRKKKVTGRKSRMTAVLLSAALTAAFCLNAPQTVEGAATADEALQNPRVQVNTCDTVYFGSYWQEDTNGDGVADRKDNKAPIRWRILSQNRDDAYVIADKVLDCKRYNEEDL